MLKMSIKSPAKEFDMKTARKIINEYADKVNMYMKENSSLHKHIEDLKESLKLNKDLIYKYVSQNFAHEEFNSLLMDLKIQNDSYMRKVDGMQNEKTQLENKVFLVNLLRSLNFKTLRTSLNQNAMKKLKDVDLRFLF